MTDTRLTPAETKFLGRALAHLNVPRVDVQVNPESTADIWIELGNPLPQVVCGQKWIGSNPTLRKTKLVHEVLHAKGMRHDAKSRQMGYYSNPERDTYSPKV